MSVVHPADLGVVEAAEELAAGRLTSEELTRSCLDRIASRDESFGAWRTVYHDEALDAAREADARRRAGDVGPLTGVPVGLKDVIGVAGRPLAGDSQLLAGNVATEDATVWIRLREAGMVLLGHLHCGEFAVGTWGSNPWNARFSPGGSSSGSAIAVATRTVPATLGSDGRGSIRIPADHNGVTGMKPSFGLVSTHGCIPISFTYDVVGPMARSARDCAALLTVLAGRDTADGATLVQPARLSLPSGPRSGPTPLSGTRIGVPRFADGQLAAGVATVFGRFQEELARLGATLVPYDRPENPLEADEGRGGWKSVLGAEALAIHRQFHGREHLHREEFSVYYSQITDEVGTAVDYVLAQSRRGELVATWRRIFADLRLDLVVEPGGSGEIWKLDEDLDLTDYPWFYSMWNDANFPVLSLPAGRSPTDGGPVGMQVVAEPFRDAAALQLGIDYQAATDYHTAEPPDLDGRPPYEPPAVPDGGPQPAWIPPVSPFAAFVLDGPENDGA
jgi:aspartyl-tRNA(Asn)/glutamyl-tRNA(Gln) amidotransferase subunit A